MITHKKPITGNWSCLGRIPGLKGTVELICYQSPLGIRVLSGVEILESGPEWHISISDNGGRIAHSLVPTILKHFGAEDFDEDNHISGKARHFWKPTNSLQAPVCPCKDNEEPVIEGDYTWRKE